MTDKARFLTIRWVNHHLVVSGPQIKSRKPFASVHRVQTRVGPWQRVSVLLSDRIQLAVVYAKRAEPSFFLTTTTFAAHGLTDGSIKSAFTISGIN